jgi:hypothetical protein
VISPLQTGFKSTRIEMRTLLLQFINLRLKKGKIVFDLVIYGRFKQHVCCSMLSSEMLIFTEPISAFRSRQYVGFCF